MEVNDYKIIKTNNTGYIVKTKKTHPKTYNLKYWCINYLYRPKPFENNCKQKVTLNGYYAL